MSLIHTEQSSEKIAKAFDNDEIPVADNSKQAKVTNIRIKSFEFIDYTKFNHKVNCYLGFLLLIITLSGSFQVGWALSLFNTSVKVR